ncbi:MAG TPA: histidine kinase [Bacteroidia bacterium]|nr:histidine kinase [Bacteroidia bacterium]
MKDLSYKKLSFAYIAYILLWAVLHVFVFHRLGFSWQIALVDSAINNGLLLTLSFAMAMSLKYFSPSRRNALMLIGWSITLAIASAWLSNFFLLQIFITDVDYVALLHKAFLIRFCVSFLIIEWVVLFSWILNRMRNRQEMDARKADVEKLLRDAELEGLRQQLQPHFLFNSLNSISALAGSKPEEARRMIQQLSDFLRGTLKKDDKQMSSLQEELKHLQLYLDIEKVRFGHRLNTEIKADEQSLALLIPPLLLQPLVENAIKFGLYDTIGDVTIQINSSLENKNLRITITNPFDVETAQPSKGTGFGLKSVQRRLHLLFFRNDLLKTEIKQNLYTTTVIIPQTI